MAHLHSVYDCDAHFVIDPNTRKIKEDTNLRTLLAQRDHNSERFTFEMSRYIEGHDMSLCDATEIHWENGSNEGIYEVGDLEISPESGDIVIFSWLITNECTQNVGPLTFGITFKCTTDGTLDYSYHILPFEKISIAKSMDKSNSIVQEYPDILVKWKQDLRDYIDQQLGVIENGSY